jgi:hypothetical protein
LPPAAADNAGMAKPAPPPRVKLICGMIAADTGLFDQAEQGLTRRLGPADVVSDVMPFDFTDYYSRQMGCPLHRKFLAFADLAQGDSLARLKRATNDMEEQFADEAPPGAPTRPINLDPGYVELGKLVLASCKNFAHRIYLAAGVYAEVTLIFRHGRWHGLPWTFPDYASGRYDPFLLRARAELARRLKEDPA